MRYFGATIGFGVVVEAEDKDQAVPLILEEARRIAGSEAFIIEMDDAEEENNDG